MVIGKKGSPTITLTLFVVVCLLLALIVVYLGYGPKITKSLSSIDKISDVQGDKLAIGLSDDTATSVFIQGKESFGRAFDGSSSGFESAKGQFERLQGDEFENPGRYKDTAKYYLGIIYYHLEDPNALDRLKENVNNTELDFGTYNDVQKQISKAYLILLYSSMINKDSEIIEVYGDGVFLKDLNKIDGSKYKEYNSKIKNGVIRSVAKSLLNTNTNNLSTFYDIYKSEISGDSKLNGLIQTKIKGDK